MSHNHTPRCFECKRADVPLKPASEYAFLMQLTTHIPDELLCRQCAGLVYFDLTGITSYVLPLDLQAHFLNSVEN